MSRLLWWLAGLMLLEKGWKHFLVIRFFRRPPPSSCRETEQVSVLQPILSGDPALAEFLRRNLFARTRYPVEFVWMIDENDDEARQICETLLARYPGSNARLVVLPPPADGLNPKMVKLIEGARQTRGEILCVLDDDTLLPDEGLEACLPFLDQPDAGVAFGLPYYTSFTDLWSGLVAYFVNSHSLMTYIPYTFLRPPFTINGMFYAVRREVLEAVGGFEGLEGTLADDFAVARRFRERGYRLVQTPLRHGIGTTVGGPRHYLSLIQRWFIFPRESLLRHLGWRDLLVLYGLGMLSSFFPLLVVVIAMVTRARRVVAYAALYFGYSYAIFAHLNVAYLRRASPWRGSWWVPVIQALFPLQLLVALLSPQKVVWRGHVMEVRKGGHFRFVRRRFD